MSEYVDNRSRGKSRWTRNWTAELPKTESALPDAISRERVCGWLAVRMSASMRNNYPSVSKKNRGHPTPMAASAVCGSISPYRERLGKVNKWMPLLPAPPPPPPSPSSPTKRSILGWLSCARPLRLSTHVCTHHLSPAHPKLQIGRAHV